MRIKTAPTLVLILVFLLVGMPATSQDPESFEQSLGISYVDWGHVELANAILYDALFVAYEEGLVTDAGLDQLLADIDWTYSYLLDYQEYYGTGGPGAADQLTTHYSMVSGRSINLATETASVQGSQATASSAMDLFIDEFGQAYLRREEGRQLDDQELAMREGWEKDYDALMLKMMKMVDQFVAEHAEPVEEPAG